MPDPALTDHTIGWIGTGRMGYAMSRRLLEAGYDVTVCNRTRSKAEPLMEFGARIVDHPAQLADRDIVFSMVSGPDDLISILGGQNGLYSGTGNPRLFIDCSSVSTAASQTARELSQARGVAMLAAPVSGNARMVRAGKLTFIASGPQTAFETARPYLAVLGRGATYAGEGELARMVKICHNLLLGVITQNLAEITTLAEKGGVSRHALLEFINNSVMGSEFIGYKTPAFVNLDMTPTFTPPLLLKDLDLGLAAGRELGVPLPVTQLTRDLLQKVIEAGYTDCDFSALLLEQARAAGLELKSEGVDFDEGM